MTGAEYLKRMDDRRQTLTGIQRTWADFNMALEIIQSDAFKSRIDDSMVISAISDCKVICQYLLQLARNGSLDACDALEVKYNQLTDLRSMLDK